MVQTVVASGHKCSGGLTGVWVQKDMSLIFDVLNLKPGFTPGINVVLSTAARKFLSIRGFLQQSFGAVQALIAQTVIYSSP
jgi:hypothetical protein